MSVFARKSLEHLSMVASKSKPCSLGICCIKRRVQGNSMEECIKELQSVSHSLYHQAMIKDVDIEQNSKCLMELSQKIDAIVLKLSNMHQIKVETVHTTQSTDNELQRKSGMFNIRSAQMHKNGDVEDDYVATQEDVDEINKEMEDLFGAPMSNVRL